MSGHDGHMVALVVGCDLPDAERLVQDIRTLTGGRVDAHSVDDAGAAIEAARRIADDGGLVPVAFVDVDFGHERGAAGAVALHADPILSGTPIVIVTSKATLRGVDGALMAGAVHGMITRPWTVEGLAPLLAAQLATFLVEQAPDRLDDFADMLDEDDHRLARERSAQRRTSTEGASPPLHPLLDSSSTPAELESRLVELLDLALGHPPRIRVAPGTILIDEGDDVGGIYVLLDGTVRLTSTTDTGERILHERSTGPVIGVLSLASHSRAMLRCQAVTDVRAIPLTLDQLARALGAEPELSVVLLRVLLTSLARRLRRSDELQVELDQSLAALSDARSQLVATARFAAVGEMAAGMAHELNNPAAALLRAIEHLPVDVRDVLLDAEGDGTGDDHLAELVARRAESAPQSTTERRALRRELTEVVGTRELADRLLSIGVTDADEARALASADRHELDRLEAAARLGETIRNVRTAAESIVTLVDSLRAYLRGDDALGPLLPDVDVAAGVEDALRLLSHRLEGATVERHYEPTPTITARPGALQQVWTNLIANALDATDEQGHLSVTVRSPRPGWVSVTIADDGPGIPDDVQARIFEPRFTTKGGRVQYGMGLGLSITRRIVDEHGGTIGVETRPGRTEFTVELPIGGST